MKRYTVLSVLGAVVAVPAFASDADVGGTYFTPMGGVLRTDKERPTDGRDYAIGSLAIGKHFSEAWARWTCCACSIARAVSRLTSA